MIYQSRYTQKCTPTSRNNTHNGVTTFKIDGIGKFDYIENAV